MRGEQEEHSTEVQKRKRNKRKMQQVQLVISK